MGYWYLSLQPAFIDFTYGGMGHGGSKNYTYTRRLVYRALTETDITWGYSREDFQ